jgi:hypothetical protein
MGWVNARQGSRIAGAAAGTVVATITSAKKALAAVPKAQRAHALRAFLKTAQTVQADLARIEHGHNFQAP